MPYQDRIVSNRLTLSQSFNALTVSYACQRRQRILLVYNYRPTAALAREVMQSPPSISTLSFEPSDLWPWSSACVGDYRGSQKIENGDHGPYLFSKSVR